MHGCIYLCFNFCVISKQVFHVAVDRKVVTTFGKRKEEEVDITSNIIRGMSHWKTRLQ